jgi:phenylpropionate dioxygenase-like ring-hydroxylating dioxygenase large terminal subunit/AcrR family transcriptional regulator
MTTEPGTQVPSAARGSKRDLIEATMSAIAAHGLSSLTSAKIAAIAGHTAASINFHFGGKQALLMSTLQHVAEEFETQIAARLRESGDDPLRALEAIIDVSLDPVLSDARRVSVWYAFLAESGARSDYQRICGDRDTAYYRAVLDLCQRIIDQAPQGSSPDSEALACGLTGLIDQYWQDILFRGDGFDRGHARQKCRAYLTSVFPWLATAASASTSTRSAANTSPLAPLVVDGVSYTLPAWVYQNEEFFALEREHVLLPAWQIVCHASELPQAGDYRCVDMLGERAFVIRDAAGGIRAFHNVCAHRAHAVVTGRSGHCSGFLTCPYHGWTYHLDGRNRAVSAQDTFPDFDRSAFGLKPIEVEEFMGLVFIRFRPGRASVAEQFRPYTAELIEYRIDEMEPIGELWEEKHPIDWKNVVENYVEDYHFSTGHPGLSALMERQYDRAVLPSGVMRLSHRMREQPRRNWSAQRYAGLLPDFPHLPREMQRRWTYFGLFPNVFLDVFPEWIDFFHVEPLGPGRVRLRSQSYGLRDERRETRAARYLGIRLNQRVQDEDNRLTRSVQEGLSSSAYQVGVLSSKEVVIKGFQDWLRERLPAARLLDAPPRGTVAEHNRAMASLRHHTARRYHS